MARLVAVDRKQLEGGVANSKQCWVKGFDADGGREYMYEAGDRSHNERLPLHHHPMPARGADCFLGSLFKIYFYIAAGRHILSAFQMEKIIGGISTLRWACMDKLRARTAIVLKHAETPRIANQAGSPETVGGSGTRLWPTGPPSQAPSWGEQPRVLFTPSRAVWSSRRPC